MSRPLTNPKKPINYESRVMMNKREFDLISLEAERAGVSFSQFMRDAVAFYLQHSRNAFIAEKLDASNPNIKKVIYPQDAALKSGKAGKRYSEAAPSVHTLKRMQKSKKPKYTQGELPDLI
jgi:hypothetical protein